MILFGGHKNVYPERDSCKDYLDTWVYDYKANTWTEMKPAVHPEYGHALRFMAYDPVNNVAIDVMPDDTRACGKKTWVYRYKRG